MSTLQRTTMLQKVTEVAAYEQHVKEWARGVAEPSCLNWFKCISHHHEDD